MANNKQKLLDYLKSRDLLSLATSSQAGPNICTVYYGVDNDYSIYIVTSPSTEHGKNISKNGLVACSIADTSQSMFNVKYKIGVQISGRASQITNPIDMGKAFMVWTRGKKEVVKSFIDNIHGGIWKSRPFIIKPTKIKWFNEELYGSEGTEEFIFS